MRKLRYTFSDFIKFDYLIQDYDYVNRGYDYLSQANIFSFQEKGLLKIW